MKILKNYIAGEFVEGHQNANLDVFDPSRGLVVAKSPDSDALDVVRAVQAANKAFVSWRETSSQERAQWLLKMAQEIEKHADELAQLEALNVGKPRWLARESDIPRAANNFRYFASLILNDQLPSAELPGQAHSYVVRDPVGVAALITPWNLPFYLLTWKLAPCLAMGNTAVCKPSELTPLTAFRFAEILHEIGLPPGVCNIVFGRGETAGAALVQHPSVPLISFTGGTETGVKIQTQAAQFLKKTSLELGGRNANIVLNDADIDKAVEGSVRAAFLNSGQICLCGSRLMVQSNIYDVFMEKFRQATAKIKLGSPMDKDVFMGPLISSEHQKQVIASIEQAKKENGKITFGGNTPQMSGEWAGGYYLEPTIIEDLTNCSDLWQREIFGPVVTAMSFKYPHDAVKWANSSSYGLSASLWTQDVTRAHKIASQIQAGTVWVNTWAPRDVRMPFGGVKMSGVGREGGHYSLDFYSQLKTITHVRESHSQEKK